MFFYSVIFLILFILSSSDFTKFCPSLIFPTLFDISYILSKISDISEGSKMIIFGLYPNIEIARFISFVNGEHTSHIPCATIMSGLNSLTNYHL